MSIYNVKEGSIWIAENGEEFKVLHLANPENMHEDYPEGVVYQHFPANDTYIYFNNLEYFLSHYEEVDI